MNKLLILGLSCLFLCQCKTVKISGPVPNPPIKHLAMVNNEDVHMERFIWTKYSDNFALEIKHFGVFLRGLKQDVPI